METKWYVNSPVSIEASVTTIYCFIQELNVANAEQYVHLVQDFCLDTGIRRQLNAFKSMFIVFRMNYVTFLFISGGFSRVFPLENLVMFSADELQLMLCGDQAPSWTREDLLHHTEPKNGYTRDSQGYLMFIDVAMDMDADERKVKHAYTYIDQNCWCFFLAELHSVCDWEFFIASRWIGQLAS